MALQTDVQQEARTQRHTDRRLHPDGDGAVSPVKSGNSLHDPAFGASARG
jgi:hypothetical protein